MVILQRYPKANSCRTSACFVVVNLVAVLVLVLVATLVECLYSLERVESALILFFEYRHRLDEIDIGYLFVK